MTDEEYAYYNQKIKLAEELRRKRARCSQVCPCYNSEDRDCEIFGHTCPPSRCNFFLEKEARKRLEEKAR